MKFIVVFLTVALFLLARPSSALHELHDFIQCLHFLSNDSHFVTQVIHTRQDTSFLPILNSTVQNPRFWTRVTPKPLAIITPLRRSHVQAAVRCARKHGIRVRTRSGGHDYEGFSYVAHVPFVVIDLRNLGMIRVNVKKQTAWVRAGATIGQFYHEIARKSGNLAFPAGICPTVGVGGHFSGGGYGTLLRKYGMAADQIIDAHLIDARGRFLDRKSMGEDWFWAIRGGGGASFGVILAWKVNLVYVPSTLTVCNVSRTLEQNAIDIIYRWQEIVHQLPNEVFLRVMWERLYRKDPKKGHIMQASFPLLYLGKLHELMPLMQERFPELGLAKTDCLEVSWIESVLWFGEFPLGEPVDTLAARTRATRSFKAKSDFVQEPMPKSALENLWKRFHAPEAKMGQLIFSPFGGKMAEVPDDFTPFPSRLGNIYEIQHLVYWEEEENVKAQTYIRWLERLFDFLKPYVSNSPRAAYINYRDIDLGRNNEGRTSYEQARVWGYKYFKNNFDRLVKVKTAVDPTNFFRDEQSIPSLKDVSG